MTTSPKNVVFIPLIVGMLGFASLIAFHFFFWRLYPMPVLATEEVIQSVWAFHVIAEKLFSQTAKIVCAILAAYPFRQEWKVGLMSAIASGLFFEGTAILTYIVRFGFQTFTDNTPVFSTIGLTVATSFAIGFIVVFKSYRVELIHKRAIKAG